jgi:hypothetical protein
LASRELVGLTELELAASSILRFLAAYALELELAPAAAS